MVKALICGGSGYAGGELLRILSHHPHVSIEGVTSERSAGKSVAALFPHLRKYSHLLYEPLIPETLAAKGDVFFMALPHGTSQQAVDFFYRQGKWVIDLSADYRLRDAGTYERWYGVRHEHTSTLGQAVYGLPEVYRESLKGTRLIANPGCYPTGALLGLVPLSRAGFLRHSSIFIDAKSGTSGAGRKGDISVSFCEINEGFKAYSVGTHRHTPEIEQELSVLSGVKVVVDFTPHLLPLDRGILSTIYVHPMADVSPESISALYRDAYEKEPFVRVLEYGVLPNIKNVRGTNFCDIGLKFNERTHSLIVITAIDNLVKGASGQAVHNMNLALGFPETTALENSAVFP
jgi:N-acetyl-gamma-glutamyl-phosphate reductase